MKTTRLIIAFIFITINSPLLLSNKNVKHYSSRTLEVLVWIKNIFTLKGVGPTVIYFCDRPVRMAGHLSLKEFMDSWTQRKDNFSDNPPNAVLSVIDDGDEMLDVVVELTQQPKTMVMS